MAPIALVTGSTSGIGLAGAGQLGRAGWRVLVHARSAQRGEPVVAQLREQVPEGTFDLVTGDLADLEEVAGLAAQVRSLTPALDVLWNNAGVFTRARQVSADGFELQMAVNHLAAFALTLDLLPQVAAASGRVIGTSSGAARLGRLPKGNPLGDSGRYRSFPVYARTKLAVILFTQELARRHGDQVSAHCFHPGLVRTRFGQDRSAGEAREPTWMPPRLSLTPDAGADTGVYLATNLRPSYRNGLYWAKRRPANPGRHATAEAGSRLWEASLAATVG